MRHPLMTMVLWTILLNEIMMYIRNEDTICAPATVPGTGAISVIRISGPEALAIADKVITCSKGTICDAKGYTMKFGTVKSAFVGSQFDFGRSDGKVGIISLKVGTGTDFTVAQFEHTIGQPLPGIGTAYDRSRFQPETVKAEITAFQISGDLLTLDRFADIVKFD